MGIGTFTQVNGIASAVQAFFDPDKANTVSIFGNDYSIAIVISAFILAILVGLVVIGGIQRICKGFSDYSTIHGSSLHSGVSGSYHS